MASEPMSTQTSKIVYDISQQIMRGELAPDATLGEAQLAQSFGVSRTPIRQALAILSDEGLLKKSSGRSYKVRRFAPKEMLDAIDVRGVLEGLAARHAAESKIGARVARELDACLAQEEQILATLESEGFKAKTIYQYFTINSRFHNVIIQGAQNETLAGALEVANRVPFVSVGSLARYKSQLETKDIRQELRYFVYSHMQHREIADAIRAGQGARAEALLREHAQLAVRNIDLESDMDGVNADFINGLDES
jgi:GntR family transcriptional regulator, vanillate catabolism transcriptional regulator